MVFEETNDESGLAKSASSPGREVAQLVAGTIVDFSGFHWNALDRLEEAMKAAVTEVDGPVEVKVVATASWPVLTLPSLICKARKAAWTAPLRP